jgi:hypothetical protein
VVSSSVSRMHCSTPQLMASLASRCANSLATLRSLLVSSLWMMAYCFAKQSSNVAWGVGGGSTHREGHAASGCV